MDTIFRGLFQFAASASGVTAAFLVIAAFIWLVRRIGWRGRVDMAPLVEFSWRGGYDGRASEIFASWPAANAVRPAAPTLDIHGAFIRRTDLGGASLRDANMSGTDATNAIFRNADFKGARLRGTILRGADLAGAKNLTLEQLSEAVVDDATILPLYIDRVRLRELVSSGWK